VKVRPLHPHAALLVQDANEKKYIAITDLHIGFEAELDAKGVTLRQNATEEMISELSLLARTHDASAFILLGDMKHKVGAITKQEWDEIPSFLKTLCSMGQEVFLIPGNHDGNIRHLVPGEVSMISSKGMMLEDTLFVHGHSMPSDVRSGLRRIVMGHLHPVFLKEGSVINGERVWIYLQAKKKALFSEEGSVDIVIVPSFNQYLYAHGPRTYRKSISPIISRVMDYPGGLEDCIVARLDGSIVGDSAVLQSII
jgi:putative SbcD/Mre11-related phosphoesterase